MKKVKEEFNQDEIDFELFSRLVAILLEENNLQRKQEENENEDENEEKEPEELKDDPTENYEF